MKHDEHIFKKQVSSTAVQQNNYLTNQINQILEQNQQPPSQKSSKSQPATTSAKDVVTDYTRYDHYSYRKRKLSSKARGTKANATDGAEEEEKNFVYGTVDPDGKIHVNKTQKVNNNFTQQHKEAKEK